MKIESIQIENFKRFEELKVSFKNKAIDEVINRFLILGDNGTGKTTLLQAIALTLGLATRDIDTVEDFDWIGFVSGRYARWGKPRIELVVTFTGEERAATREIARLWYDNPPEYLEERRSFEEPGDSERVTLVLEGIRCRAVGGSAYLYQFRGRDYAKSLVKRKSLDYDTRAYVRSRFLDLPGIFWFDQFRNLGSRLIPIDSNGDEQSEKGNVSYDFGVERLREFLNGWVLGRQSTYMRYPMDYYLQLENLYKRIFPGRSFAGVEPMLETGIGGVAATSKDYYFLLHDGSKHYDIVEMSAGEQAVFPILYEFVRQQIANSVVLIDEIDLNLHPPIAQLLVRQLPVISSTCQFIFTTHSEAVSDIISEAETYRLPGGSVL